MRILFLAFKIESNLYYGITENKIRESLQEKFTGSVLYGPGYRYTNSSLPEILEECGGQDKFDAIMYCLPERVMLGEPFGENIIEHYSLTPKLWSFPKNSSAVRLPKMMFFSDFWHLTPSEWSYIFLHHGIDVALTTFIPPFVAEDTWKAIFPLEIRERVPFIPIIPTLNPDTCPDLHQERPYDVYMGGVQVPSFYPVRQQMLHAFHESSLSLYAQRHPGYNFKISEEKRSDIHPYVRALNRSKISAFCSTRFNVITSKLIEAMSSGAIAMCDFIHGIEHLGLIPGEHFIQADGSNCVAKATALLADQDKLMDMRQKASEAVRKHFTLEGMTNQLTEMLPAVLNGEKPPHWAALSPNLALTRARRRLAAQNKKSAPKVVKRSIFECALQTKESTWQLWKKLAKMHCVPQEETNMLRLPGLFPARHLLTGHLDLLYTELLIVLAQNKKPRRIVEMGTHAGFISMALAQYLHDAEPDAEIYAAGLQPHTQPFHYLTQFTLERPFSRESLTNGLPGIEMVHFIMPEQLEEALEGKGSIDLLLLNDENAIAAHYALAKPLLDRNCLIVINGYGESAPAVVYAVEEIARENGLNIEHFSAEPSIPGLAILQA